MIKLKYLLIFIVSLSCNKEADRMKQIIPDNTFIKFFDENNPETHMYVSGMSLYSDTEIIFTTHNYNNKFPLYLVRNYEIIEVDTSNILSQLPDMKLFHNSKSKKIWANEYCIISYSPNSKNYRYWTVNSKSQKNSSIIKEDGKGALWEATYYDGLYRYSVDSIQHYFKGYSFGEICNDSFGNIVVGTLPNTQFEKGVVLKYNYYQWDTIYTSAHNSFWISSICYDNFNNFWFSSLSRTTIGYDDGGGLIKFNNGQTVEYTKNNSKLTSNSVTELYIDIKDNMLIGTYFGGMCKLDTLQNWFNFTLKNEVGFSQNVENIIIDKNNNIWISIQFLGLVCLKEDYKWE